LYILADQGFSNSNSGTWVPFIVLSKNNTSNYWNHVYGYIWNKQNVELAITMHGYGPSIDSTSTRGIVAKISSGQIQFGSRVHTKIIYNRCGEIQSTFQNVNKIYRIFLHV
jgi:hypothetical protein